METMMIEAVLCAVAYSTAAIVGAALAHHGFMRWLDDRAASRVQENVLAEASRRLDQTDQVISKLAVDWRAKFVELENEWKQLKQHADSQFAGAVAQLPTTRGFGR